MIVTEEVGRLVSQLAHRQRYDTQKQQGRERKTERNANATENAERRKDRDRERHNKRQGTEADAASARVCT